MNRREFLVLAAALPAAAPTLASTKPERAAEFSTRLLRKGLCLALLLWRRAVARYQ